MKSKYVPSGNLRSRESRPRVSRSKSSVPLLLEHCRAVNLPTPTPEHRFHPTRRWRFDLAFIDQKLAVEVEGGLFIQGRHSRGAGAEADCEKYAEAAIAGWTVLRVSPRQIKNGIAVDWIARWLAKTSIALAAQIAAGQSTTIGGSHGQA